MRLRGDFVGEVFEFTFAEAEYPIIDAALAIFGINGYKKASVSDIAAAAGISKAMVFRYYFSYNRMIAGDGLNPGIAALSIFLVAVFTVFTYFFYKKRDLTV